LRRNPEIRWRLSPADIPFLADAQKRILRNATEVVKPGGLLVYSTCSVEREENEDVIEEVLGQDDRFRPVKTFRTWPHREGADGFFVGIFQK
jgi:16S rRNA (cytosine967-C5)-methyltransferase